MISRKNSLAYLTGSLLVTTSILVSHAIAQETVHQDTTRPEAFVGSKEAIVDNTDENLQEQENKEEEKYLNFAPTEKLRLQNAVIAKIELMEQEGNKNENLQIYRALSNEGILTENLESLEKIAQNKDTLKNLSSPKVNFLKGFNFPLYTQKLFEQLIKRSSETQDQTLSLQINNAQKELQNLLEKTQNPKEFFSTNDIDNIASTILNIKKLCKQCISKVLAVEKSLKKFNTYEENHYFMRFFSAYETSMLAWASTYISNILIAKLPQMAKSLSGTVVNEEAYAGAANLAKTASIGAGFSEVSVTPSLSAAQVKSEKTYATVGATAKIGIGGLAASATGSITFAHVKSELQRGIYQALTADPGFMYKILSKIKIIRYFMSAKDRAIGKDYNTAKFELISKNAYEDKFLAIHSQLKNIFTLSGILTENVIYDCSFQRTRLYEQKTQTSITAKAGAQVKASFNLGLGSISLGKLTLFNLNASAQQTFASDKHIASFYLLDMLDDNLNIVYPIDFISLIGPKYINHNFLYIQENGPEIDINANLKNLKTLLNTLKAYTFVIEQYNNPNLDKKRQKSMQQQKATLEEELISKQKGVKKTGRLPVFLSCLATSMQIIEDIDFKLSKANTSLPELSETKTELYSTLKTLEQFLMYSKNKKDRKISGKTTQQTSGKEKNTSMNIAVQLPSAEISLFIAGASINNTANIGVSTKEVSGSPVEMDNGKFMTISVTLSGLLATGKDKIAESITKILQKEGNFIAEKLKNSENSEELYKSFLIFLDFIQKQPKILPFSFNVGLGPVNLSSNDTITISINMKMRQHTIADDAMMILPRKQNKAQAVNSLWDPFSISVLSGRKLTVKGSSDNGDNAISKTIDTKKLSTKILPSTIYAFLTKFTGIALDKHYNGTNEFTANYDPLELFKKATTQEHINLAKNICENKYPLYELQTLYTKLKETETNPAKSYHIDKFFDQLLDYASQINSCSDDQKIIDGFINQLYEVFNIYFETIVMKNYVEKYFSNTKLHPKDAPEIQ